MAGRAGANQWKEEFLLTGAHQWERGCRGRLCGTVPGQPECALLHSTDHVHVGGPGREEEVPREVVLVSKPACCAECSIGSTASDTVKGCLQLLLVTCDILLALVGNNHI